MTLIAVAAIALACVLVFVLFPRGGGDEGQGQSEPTPSAGRRRRLAAASPRPVPRRRRRTQRRPAGGDHERRGRRAHHALQRPADLADRLLTGRQVAGLHRRHLQAERAVALLRDERRRTAGDGRDARHRRRRQRRLALGGQASRRRLHGDAQGHRPERRPSRLRRPRQELLTARRRRRARAAAASPSAPPTTGAGSPSSPTRTARPTSTAWPRAKERLELLERASGGVPSSARTRRCSTSTRAPSTTPSSRRTAQRSSTAAPAATWAPATRSSPPTARTLMPARETQLPAGYAWDPDGYEGGLHGPLAQAGRQRERHRAGHLLGLRHRGRLDHGAGPLRGHAWCRTSPGRPTASPSPGRQYEQKKYRTGTVYLLPASGGDSTPLVEEALSRRSGRRPPRTPLQTSPSP